MEEERRPLAVAHVLDVAEEEGVVAAPVRADDARHELGERVLDEGRLADDLEQRLTRMNERVAAQELEAKAA